MRDNKNAGCSLPEVTEFLCYGIVVFQPIKA